MIYPSPQTTTKCCDAQSLWLLLTLYSSNGLKLKATHLPLPVVNVWVSVFWKVNVQILILLVCRLPLIYYLNYYHRVNSLQRLLLNKPIKKKILFFNCFIKISMFFYVFQLPSKWPFGFIYWVKDDISQLQRLLKYATYLTHLGKKKTNDANYIAFKLTVWLKYIVKLLLWNLFFNSVSSVATFTHHQKTTSYKLHVLRDRPCSLLPHDHLPAPSDRQVHPCRRPTLCLSETLKHHNVWTRSYE